MPHAVAIFLLIWTAAAVPAAAQSPAAPAPGETITRAPNGSVTIRAVRLEAPLRLDGVLDEDVYTRVRPASGFIQIEPTPGAPARDQTEIWVMFDEEHVFVAARAWDSDMNIVTPEMRRDNLWTGNDTVGFAFDTFLDRRNALVFHANALGARHDGQATNESQWNGDWNPIWEPATARFDGGWTLEAAIPFRSLRYGPGREQVWGFQVLRPSRSINEISFLTPVPSALGQSVFLQVSLYATLVGIEAPPSSRLIELKPFATASATADEVTGARERIRDFGVDAKVGLTDGLSADFTYNTDFAQVEADEQQINLTRFSLFFPEKREFFLENAGTFSFGGVALSGRTAGSNLAPVLFYSRRIGLEGNTEVPLRVGGRVTGRAGPFSVGLINLQSSEVEDTNTRATNFSVVRVKRDILRRSAVGLLATARSVDADGRGASYAYGLDGTFGFFDAVTVNTYWARTDVEGKSGDNTSHRLHFNYNADRYGVELERLAVGGNFDPQVGFARRQNMRRSFGLVRFSPRPAGLPAIRQFNWTGSANYIENGAGVLETRELVGTFDTELVNDDIATVTYTHGYEFLPKPFEIARGVILPVGGYDFDDVQVAYAMAQQRPIRANLIASRGTFYSGHRTAIGASSGRVRVTNQFSLEPSYTFNDVNLREGDFRTHLLSTRATYTMSPTSFVSVLVQYSSRANTVSTNARLRWEYQPGSELFIVYNEQRDTLTPRLPDIASRAIIVKVNRLFRF